ncbi:MAG: carboxypeptidase regulatory-like domain-containing protein [Saprospiraceae bacterium]|nr:carboxypeptidase regulatory-like domain-containing protein [Saprospiraceae bacterium]
MGRFYQDVTGIPVGTYMVLSFWGGVHNSSANTLFGVEFYNNNTYLSESTVQIDKILGGSPSMQFYTIHFVVPANTTKVRVIGKMNGDWLKVDQICLQTSSCDPDNASAPPFCAPQPTCAQGSFLWSQSINPSNGDANIRMWCGSTTTFTIPGPYPANFASGQLIFTISDAVSYDGYSGRNTVTQPNERWRLVFRKNNVTVGTSQYTGDVPDQRTQGYWRGSLGTVTVPNGVDQIIIEHWSVANDGSCNNGPNSVVPVSVCISAAAPNPCVNFQALAQSELNLVKSRTISDEITCVSQPNRVLWLDCILDNSSGGTGGNLKFWRIISGGTFKEYCDGTAHFNMRVQNVVNSNYKFDVSVILTGRTFTAPSGSPHLEGCTSSASSNWYYYTGMKGSLIGLDGLSGGNISIDRKGGSFQIGTNASLWGTSGSFGASGWIMYEIISNPTAFNFKAGCGADFNFFLSGGNLTSAEASNCQTVCAGSSVELNAYAVGGRPNYTYQWSNGLGAGQNKTVNPTTTTTYTVTITDSNLCTSTDQVTINVTPNPSVNAGVDATICPGQQIIITASATGGTSPYTYAWNNGLGNGASKTVNPSATTTYIVTVTDSKGCTATDDIVVTVGGNINLTATGGEICVGGTTQISASASGGTSPYTYTWSDGLGNGATKNVSPAATKTYSVTVTDGNGCTKTATATVTVNQRPTVTANAPDVCAGSTLVITSSPTGGTSPYTYTWTGPGGFSANTQNINRTNSTTSMSGTYALTVTDAKGCTGTTTVNALVKPAATVDVGPDISICSGDQIVINSTVSGIPNCGTPGTTRCNNPISNSGGYITDLNTAGVCGDNAGAKLWTQGGQGTSFITLDMSSNVPVGTQICVRVKLEHCSNSSFSVADMRIRISTSPNSGFTDLVASQTFSHTNYQTYCFTLPSSVRYVRVQDNGKCSMRLDFLQFTTPDSFNNSLTYNWSGPGILGPNNGTSITVNQSGTYTLVVTDCTGCTASDQVVVNIHNNVVANVNDAEICAGQSVTLTANTLAGASYSWTEAGSTTVISTAQSITVSPSSTTSYIVTIRVNGCEDSDDALVTVNPKPNLSLTANPSSICNGSSTTISASASGGTGSYTFAWNQGLGTGNSKTVNPTTNTTYTVTVTDSKGCTDTQSITITVFPLLNISVNSPSVCLGESTQLTAAASGGQPNYTFNWSNGLGSGPTKSVSPSTTTTYTVTVTDANGCTKTATATVTVLDKPVASAVNDGPLTCLKTSVTLTASPATGVTYLWSNQATTQTVNVTSPGTYTVTVTSVNNGCTSTASTTVILDNNPPTANAGPDVTVNCANPSATLTATGGGTYLWNTGQTTASITVNPENTTTYTVTVTASNGCTATDAVIVTANKAKPTASISATGNNCITPNAQLFGSATGGTSPYTYVWSGPNGFTSTQQNPTITNNGTYTLTVTDTNGCTDTESIVIFAEFVPVIVVVSTEICKGETVTLNASGGVSYQWGANANNATTASVQVTPLTTSTYTVTVTSANGCVSTANVLITVYDLPVINSLNVIQNSSCNNQNNTGSITVNATGQSGLTLQYRINGGPWQLSNVFNNLGNGTYNVEVSYTTRLCLSLPQQATIISQPGLVLVAEDDKFVCPNVTFTLSANATGGTMPYTFNWSNGVSGPNITINNGISANTTYSVTVTDNKGCTATDQVLVSVHPNLTVSASAPEVCEGFNLIITSTPSGGTPGFSYVWSGPNGYSANSQSITRTNATTAMTGVYSVTVTDTKGCSATAQVNAAVNPNPTVQASSNSPVCTNSDINLFANVSGGTMGYTYTWTGPSGFSANSQNPVRAGAAPNMAGTYNVTVTDSKGCTATSSTNIIINPLPNSGINGPMTTCAKEPVLFTAIPAGPGSVYSWIFQDGIPATASGPSATSQWNTPGEYGITLTVTKDGCTSQYTTSIIITQEVFAVTGPDKEICQGGSTLIPGQGPPGATFKWTVIAGDPTSIDNGANSATVEVSPLVTTTYRLTVTQNGCVRTADITVIVNVNYNPIADAGQNAFICAGENFVIGGNPTGTPPPATPNAPLGYTWSPSTGLNNATIANPTLNINTPGTYNYQVIVFSLLTGCSDTATVTHTIEPKAKVGDFVWEDLNGNGLQDPGEPAIPNVSVKLFNASNNALVAQTTTNSNGLYEFTVCKGTYYIEFGNVSGFNRTKADNGDDTKDSDANETTGQTANFTLNPGDNNKTIDAGYYRPATIGDFVWDDKNANGVQDAGEPGIAGLTVTLSGTAGDGTPVNLTTVTGPNGEYSFTGLKPGSYTVTFTKPGGTIYTQPDQGGDDTKDSDANPVTGSSPVITVVSGETNNTVDAGILRPASLGDFVWEDKNGNGIQDAGEPGIAGVVVMLEDGSGNPATDINGNVVASVVTNASGQYGFTNLKPGVGYVVKFTKPAGYEATAKDQGGDDTKDSDADVVTGKAPVVVLQSGENNPTIDAGYYRPATIGDFVWDDKNANGVQDAGEPGIPGLTVTLSGTAGDGTPVNLTTVTGPNGEYSFTGLKPGSYTVTFTKPGGTIYTQPDQGGDDTKDSDANPVTGSSPVITVVSGETNNTVDAGILRPASLGDFVWEDKNGNGIQDAGEPGIAGVVVMLEDGSGNPATDINGNVVASVVTNASGQYGFTNLKPGVGYVVKFTKPAGYEATAKDQGGDDTKDSDADVVTGKAPVVVLQSGENNPTIDAGYYRPATIGDFVWDDKNANGVQDAGEPGIAGLTVTLSGTAGDGTPVNLTTVTGPNGEYSFTGLKPGSYTVTFTKPGGTIYTQPDQGGDDTKDSDANPVTGSSPVITVVSGETNNTVDAGILRPASLGDFVWEDKNGNGIQDAGEPGIAGVVVMLEDGSGNPATDINGNVVASVVTNASGQYGFTNLKPGVGYVVKFTKPAGYEATAKDQEEMIRRTAMRT